MTNQINDRGDWQKWDYSCNTRDRVAGVLANFMLRFATLKYREFIAGSIKYGMASAVRDLTDGREPPESWIVEYDKYAAKNTEAEG